MIYSNYNKKKKNKIFDIGIQNDLMSMSLNTFKTCYIWPEKNIQLTKSLIPNLNC